MDFLSLLDTWWFRIITLPIDFIIFYYVGKWFAKRTPLRDEKYWEDAEKLLAIIKTATDMQQALNPDSVTPKTKPRPAKNRNTTKKTEAIHKNNSNPFSDALSNF